MDKYQDMQKCALKKFPFLNRYDVKQILCSLIISYNQPE